MTAALLLPLMPAACNVQLPDLIDIDSHGQNDRIYYPEHNRRDDYERERDQYDAGGLIRTDRGECLDIHGDDHHSLIRYRCHGQSNQQFRFDSRSGTIRQNGQCLTQTGSSITLEPCTSNRNQEWYSDGKRLCSRSANAQCWSVSQHSVRLQTRNDSPEQEVLR